MRGRRGEQGLVALGVAALAFAVALPGLAAESPAVESPAAEDRDAEDITEYWATSESRSFVSGQVSLGPLSQLALFAGQGRPHYAWAGLEAQALSSTEFGALHAGLRADLLLVNLSVGARYTWAYGRRFPSLRESFDEDSLVDPARPRSRYPSLDACLWGYVPAGVTLGSWEVDYSWLFDKAPTDAVFEEYTRFTITRDSVLMARVAWYGKLLQSRLLVGPAADVVWSDDREPLWRVGGSLDFRVTRHVGVTFHLTVPVKGPDELSWVTQSWGIARLSWSFASGEPDPGWN